MNSEQLKYFEHAFRERNYSAASRRVPVSQQALVKGIRSLEKELGVPLFEPDPASGRPTPTVFAYELYDFVAVYNSNVLQLHESLARLTGEVRTEIRLGCSLGVPNAYGPSFLRDFEAIHADIEVSLFESSDYICERELRDGRFDLAIVVSPLTQGCRGECLYQSPMYFWTKSTSALARMYEEEGAVGIEGLSGLSIAIPGKGYKCYHQLVELAEARGVHLARINEVNEIFCIYDLATRGEAIGFSNGTLIDMPCFNYDPTVVAIPIDGLSWGFSIECPDSRIPSGNERLIWEWARTHARDLPHNQIARKGQA